MQLTNAQCVLINAAACTHNYEVDEYQMELKLKRKQNSFFSKIKKFF